MYRPSRLKLLDVNPNLICVLCGGYFVDATTIVECLHSFCKTCIVRYLETSKYCPICDVQVHKTKPLQNIRSDQTLQNIVYKLVPGLFQNEMRQRREFYALHPDVAPVSEYDAGIINEETSYIYSPDETVALCLEYGRPSHNPQVLDTTKQSDTSSSKKECHQHQQHRRYLRCPAAVTVSHLKKLLRSKYGLSSDHRVDLMYNEELLREDFSLMDVAYVYLWRRKGPMHLTYRIFERPHKRRKLDLERDKVAPIVGVADVLKNNIVGSVGEVKVEVDSKPDNERLIHNQIPSVQELELKGKTSETDKVKSDTKPTNGVDESVSNEEWKEVQLQISENGVMSVRNMDDLVSAVEVGVIGGAFNETIISSGKAEENKDDLGKTGLDNSMLGEKDGSKLPEKKSEVEEGAQGTSLDKQPVKKTKDSSKDSVVLKSVASIDNKDANGPPSTTVQSSKVNVMDKVSGTRVCDVNKHSFSKKEANIKPKEVKSKEVSSDIGTSLASSECLLSTNSPQPGATVSTGSVSPSVTLTPLPPHTMSSSLPMATPIPKRPNSSPVGYKTLKTPPKTWNPSIPRASFLANHATFGKSAVGGSGNLNGNITTPGQSVSSSKVEGKVDGKVNSTSSEGGSGTNNGVRLPPTSSPKPLRFFKMRNNMPRYLGNPSSGVKPMYQVQTGGGSAAAPITPKPPLSTAKVDSKVSSAPQLPTSSTMTECKSDKSGSITSKVAFPITPTSKSSPKSSSGMNSATGSSPGQSAPPAFSHTPTSSASASHTTQLPTTRTSQSTSPYVTNTTLASSGYHPSLPPSISMIFGPSRPATTERPSSQTPPPAVQRVPASVHHFHPPLPITPIHLLQHRQAAKTPGKLNGELSNTEVKSLSKSGSLEGPNVGSPVLDTHKGKEGPSREGAKEPVNGKIEGSSTAAKTPPIVEGKSMAPSKC